MIKRKNFKEVSVSTLKKMAWDFKKILSNVLIFVGFYYLLVSANIIKTKVIWLITTTILPTSRNVFILGLIMIVVGLLLQHLILIG
jgi:hypothetical protein